MFHSKKCQCAVANKLMTLVSNENPVIARDFLTATVSTILGHENLPSIASLFLKPHHFVKTLYYAKGTRFTILSKEGC